ncbi:efflux RND transporter periplasmic adaptor subunit [Veillonella agrestimuris]|uniref:efflux RND transporter periplasmic adaptor subunit n=1 Tax=Veillonella agrestimuris TaxID=2941340 RepID=UPI00203EE965|nr:efflux RND transporter periplasmic adaptor subunit [Veillonella agrestimuris]
MLTTCTFRRYKSYGYALLLPLLFLSTTLLAGCGSEEPTKDISIKVRTITVGDVASTANANYAGTVHNRTETNLAFQVGGRIINKYVTVGDTVEAGQVLAQINNIDTINQVVNAEGAVSAAQSAYELALVNANRYRQLYAEQAISKLQLDQMENQLRAAEAQLQQAQASLNLSSNQNNYTTLVAPESGIMTAFNIEVGQVVAAGQNIGTLAAGNEPEAVIALPEQELSSVQVGTDATVTFWALPDVSVQGVVREISPVPDPVARTYTVKISLLNPPPSVQLGMTTNVILKHPSSQTISIPLTALIKDNTGNPAVYIIKDGKAHVTPIQTGDFGDNSIVVTSGLSQGDIVITAGTQQLQEGTAVKQ